MARAIRDGRQKHRLYQVWRGMLKRCLNRNATGFKNYGGRGIRVCESWRKSFWRFVADVGPRPSPSHTLDRYPDMNGDYRPGNVRWATKSQQRLNSRAARPLTARGRTQAMVEWSRETGLAVSTIFNRLRRGWSEEDAVGVPRQAKSPDNSLFPPGGREKCRDAGVNVFTVASRLRRGWSLSKALAVPVAPQKGGRRG